MALLFVPFFLLTLLPGVFSQVTLKESGQGAVRPGETLELTCTVTGRSVTSSYWWPWIRQRPGKGLEWMGYWTGSTQYAPSLRDRITISVDSSQTKYFLRLSSVTAADTAMYYCATYNWGYPFDYWGQGTTVIVTSASPTAPVVFPLSPCCQDLATASQVTVGCLVSGFFPEPVKVQWNSGSSSDIRTFPALLDSSSGHYTLSSQLTIPTSTWESEKLQCHIAHTATSSSSNKEIGPCEKKDPVAPKVRLLHSSCKASSGDATIELVCVISSFYPDNVTVNWLVSGKPMSQPSFTEQPWKDTRGHTFSTISTVNISQADWEDGNVYVCQVSHTATQTMVRSKAKICEESSGTPLKVFILPPSPSDIYMDKQPKLSCVVVNLESEEEELEVTWSRQAAGSLSPEPLAWREEVNNTFTASSSVTISESDWLSGATFICTVKHPSLPQPKAREISKKKETKEAPGVYLFHPHNDELRSNGRYVSITALVNGFKPSDISLKWLKNGNPLPEADYISTPVYSDGDGSYFLFSKLKVPKADWNRGDAYTCMVVHEGLTLKFIQKTIEKSRDKK